MAHSTNHVFLGLLCCLIPCTLPAQTTIELNPVKDNTIYSENDNSNALGHLFAGRTADIVNDTGDLRRALLEFDLSQIPAGATLTGASLELTKNKGGYSFGAPFTLHKVTQEWGEGTSDPGGSPGGTGVSPTPGDATWNFAMYNTQPWPAGGSFNSASNATTVVNSSHGTLVWSSDTLVSDILGWIQDPSSNHGWILICDLTTLGTAARFYSREASVGRPVLKVTYESDCPPTLTLNGIIPSGQYNATQMITASGTIQSGSEVFFSTNGMVQLEPDFEVAGGAYLEINTASGCP